MTKHIRKILPLLLCVLLFACLLPAAYADGVAVSTLEELQNALNSSQNCVSTGKIGGPGSGIELTVPTGVTLDITSGFVCVSSMTVNGTVNVGDNGMLMVDQSLTGSGSINVAAGCQTLNLPAACYDSETHGLVSLIHNNCSNVALVHIPATYAELQSALLKAEDAASYGIDSGILIAQNLTISQNEVVDLGNMVLSVQYGATLTLDDGAVVVTKQDVMVEQSSIHVRGGAVLAASVQLNASVIDFSNGGGFFGKRFKVRNTEVPAACIRGLDLTQAERIDEESRTIFEFHINEPIYGGDPTVDSELALRNAISAFNQLREQDPSARIDAYTSGDFTITGNITIPDGFQLRCGNNLTIAADAVVTVDGKLDAIEGGHVNILGTVINNNQFRMFDTGVMELSGTLVNNHSVYYKSLSTDRMHLVINSGATFTNNSDFAIADDIVRDPAVLGVDVDGYCVARMWDEPDMSRYCAPEVFSHFEGMCSSGKFVYLELHGIEEISITESMHIPENMTVEMSETMLIVPSGRTLTVNGALTVKELRINDGGTVNVAGTLNANRPVVLGNNQAQNVNPKLVIAQGATFNPGSLQVRNYLTVGNVVEGVDLSDYCFHTNYGGDSVIYYPASELRFGTSTLEEKRINYLEVHGIDTVTFNYDEVIPAIDGVPATINMEQTDLIVPSGRTLKVLGELYVKDIVVENGAALEVRESGRIEAAGKLDNKGTVVVKDDGSLTVNGEIVNGQTLGMAGNGTVTVPGKLTNNATIGMGENAQIAVSGQFVNNRLINLHEWNGTRPLINIGAQATYEEHGGFDVLTSFDYEGAISTIDLSDYCRLVYITDEPLMEGNDHVTRLFPGKDLSFDPNGFKQMCENGDTVYLEIRGRETFQIDSNVTIPSGMDVVVKGVDLIIPAGVDVTLKGRIILCDGAALELAGSLRKGTLELDAGTTVNLTGSCRLEPSKLRLDGEIAATGGGMSGPKLVALTNGRPNGRITVSGGSRPAVRIDGLDETKLSEWVKFNDNEGYFVLYYHAESDADFASAMERMKALPARFYGIQKLDYPAIIQGNVEFPGMEIRVDNSNGGSLTIAEGAVLTAPTVMLQGTKMTISGTFISIPRDEPNNNHNGALILTQNDGFEPMLTVTDSGIIGGADCTIELPLGTTDPASYVSGVNPGQLTLIPDPYRPFAVYRVIPELRLPAALNTIESEAFAGGGFNSVYIPAGVSSIASDAFGDMIGLKVYGEYGTEAAAFAAEKGFPFAPLN